jgi:hypothetical protein
MSPSYLPFVCFDIETIPMPECARFLDFDSIEAPSNYKDEAKIAAYIEDKKRRKVDEAGLDIDLCEVAAIAYEDQDGQGGILLRGLLPEHTMLTKFWAAVEARAMVGFNIWHFDLPVLLRRSLYLGIKAPAIRIDSYRPDGVSVLDVGYALSHGRRDLLRSLDFYCKRFGIPHDDTVKGEDIADLVAAGDWSKVSAHAYDDMAAAKALALRIGLVKATVAA